MSGVGEYLGVVLVLIGSVGNNLGNNLVSMGHKVEHVKDTTTKVSPNSGSRNDISIDTEPTGSTGEEEIPENVGCCSWRTLGVIAFVAGNIINFGSFAFGSQAVVASLDSIQFVSNVAFAKFIHKEVITWRILLATASIVIGNVMVVIFAQLGVTLFNSQDMIDLYKTNHTYHAYVAFALCLWAFTAYTYNYYYKVRMFERRLLYRHSIIEPLCYAISSTIIGTQAVLNAKSMALLISVSGQTDRNEFEHFYIYIMLGTWLLLVAYWLRRLDLGLKLFPPVFIIPVMQVFFILFAIVCGGIYFREFEAYGPLQFTGFCIGVVLILGGVYALAPPDMQLYVPDAEEETCVLDVERAVSMAESDKGTGAIDDNLNSKALEKKLSRHMKKYGQNRAAGGAIGEDRLLDDMPDPESGLNRLKPHANTHGRPPSTAGTVAVWEPDEDDEQGQLRQSPEASPTQQQQQEQPQQQAQPINNSGGEVSKSHESEQPAEQHPFEPSASTIPDPRLRLALGGGVGPGPSQGQETIPPSSSTVEPYTSARSTTPSLPVSPGGSSARGSSRGTEREHLQHRRGIAQDEDMAAPGHGVNSSDIEQAASAWAGPRPTTGSSDASNGETAVTGAPPSRKKSRKVMKRGGSAGRLRSSGAGGATTLPAVLPPVRPGSASAAASSSRPLGPSAGLGAEAGSGRPRGISLDADLGGSGRGVGAPNSGSSPGGDLEAGV